MTGPRSPRSEVTQLLALAPRPVCFAPIPPWRALTWTGGVLPGGPRAPVGSGSAVLGHVHSRCVHVTRGPPCAQCPHPGFYPPLWYICVNWKRYPPWAGATLGHSLGWEGKARFLHPLSPSGRRSVQRRGLPKLAPRDVHGACSPVMPFPGTLPLPSSTSG